MRELSELQQSVDQLVESLFGRPGLMQSGSQGEAPLWRPLADLSETDNAYLIEVEVPGVNRDDVTLELAGGELTISGEYRQSEKAGVLRSRTRRVGRFEYRVVLPNEVDADKVSAELADGVLTVTVPKAETAQPRRIEITGH